MGGINIKWQFVMRKGSCDYNFECARFPVSSKDCKKCFHYKDNEVIGYVKPKLQDRFEAKK